MHLVLRLLAFVFALSCVRVASAGESALLRVKKAGVLRWGADVQGGEPYAYTDPKDPSRIVGFEVDLANAIARELSVRAEFSQCDWSTLVASLERGTFDMAMNGLEVTEARKARILMSRPYYVFAERLVVRDVSPIETATLPALSGKRVGTLASSLAHELLKDRATPVLYEGVEEPYIDLLQGRTDAVLLDDIIAERYGKKAGLRVLGDVTEGNYAIGFRRGDESLQDAVNQALAHLAQTGEWQAILTRAGLWNARQQAIASMKETLPSMAAVQPSAPPPQAFGLGHFVLFLKSAGVTFGLSVAAMVLAMLLGLLLATARLYGGSVLAFFASTYIEVYRGTPLLLQLYLLYFGLAPIFSLSAWAASIVGLGMNYAAYEAETYRAGIQSVPVDQMEAALSLGLTRRSAFLRVVLPQAVRHALPNMTSDFIALLKDSSLVSVITLVELTKQMTITAVDVRGWLMPGLSCAVLYFAMSYPLSALSRRLERKWKRKDDGPSGSTERRELA